MVVKRNGARGNIRSPGGRQGHWNFDLGDQINAWKNDILFE